MNVNRKNSAQIRSLLNGAEEIDWPEVSELLGVSDAMEIFAEEYVKSKFSIVRCKECGRLFKRENTSGGICEECLVLGGGEGSLAVAL